MTGSLNLVCLRFSFDTVLLAKKNCTAWMYDWLQPSHSKNIIITCIMFNQSPTPCDVKETIFRSVTFHILVLVFSPQCLVAVASFSFQLC